VDDGPTWCVYLLPYLEQKAQFDSFDFTRPWQSQTSPSVKIPVPAFNCPTRRGAMMSTQGDDQAGVGDWPGFVGSYPTTPHNPGPVGDYAVCVGSTLNDDPKGDPFTVPANPGNGTFGERIRQPGEFTNVFLPPSYRPRPGPLGLRDIKDGTSNTLAVGEKHVHTMNYGRKTGPNWAGTQNCSDNCTYHGDTNSTAARAAGTARPLARDFEPCANVQRFGCAHPNGVNFAMADGSVRSLSFTIAPNVLQSLATRAGSEAVELP
jgi:prepilin-type processing-associated H-X9-DG protein